MSFRLLVALHQGSSSTSDHTLFITITYLKENTFHFMCT